MDALEMSLIGLDDEAQAAILPMLGKECCRVRFDVPGLSLGFGEKIPHNLPGLTFSYYGEWEIGTTFCGWRVLDKESSILCGSDDYHDSGYIERILTAIHFGRIISIANPTRLDVRVGLTSGIFVDFMTTSSTNGECFHVFCPNSVYVEFTIGGVWRVGKI